MCLIVSVLRHIMCLIVSVLGSTSYKQNNYLSILMAIFPGEPGLLKLRMMEVVVTTADYIMRAKLQSNRHHQQTKTQLPRGRIQRSHWSPRKWVSQPDNINSGCDHSNTFKLNWTQRILQCFGGRSYGSSRHASRIVTVSSFAGGHCNTKTTIFGCFLINWSIE